MMHFLPEFAAPIAAMAATELGLHLLKLLGTIGFSVLLIWLVIRILKQE